MQPYEEKFFIRCEDPKTGEVYMKEIVGDMAFEYKGFRFFAHGGRVSDALCGMAIFKAPDEGIFYFDMVERAQEKIEKNFDKYLAQAKKRKRANWIRRDFSFDSTASPSEAEAV